MRTLCLFLLLTTLFSCNNQQASSLLNTDALPLQNFRINTAKDTVLKTAGGALLTIGKESFSDAGEVELQVREAYSMEDIVKAGLTTMSDGKPLRSGGMIYIGAKGGVTLTKQMKVEMPTKDFDAGMKLYKGEEKDGKINWTDPKPLSDSMPAYIKSGKTIFDANCATCHALDRKLTGSALFGVEMRGPWNERENLIEFIHNPGGYIPLTNYTKCLMAEFAGQIMPSFPQLANQEIEAIFDYIKYEEIRQGKAFYRSTCDDSCRRYDSALSVVNKLKQKRAQLIDDNGPMTDLQYDTIASVVVSTGGSRSSEIEKDKVKMEDNRANYYQFSITALGWYNLDMLLKEKNDLTECKLTVQLAGERKSHVDIYLAIPSVKLFIKAGRTDNKDEFAFDNRDGTIPLPLGSMAYVFAMSEDANGVSFASKEFTVSASQNLVLELLPSTAENIHAFFDRIKLENVSVNIKDSKNATEIRKADRDIFQLEHGAEALKPKNCACFCESVQLSIDSTFAK